MTITVVICGKGLARVIVPVTPGPKMIVSAVLSEFAWFMAARSEGHVPPVHEPVPGSSVVVTV
jgi:hypothetical protein